MKDGHWNAGLTTTAGVTLGVIGTVLVATASVHYGALQWSDWLQFSGAILGALIALAAAISAWRGLKGQLDAQERTIEMLTREQSQRALHAALKIDDELFDVRKSIQSVSSAIHYEANSGAPILTVVPPIFLNPSMLDGEDMWRIDPDFLRACRVLLRRCDRWNNAAADPNEVTHFLNSLRLVTEALERSERMSKAHLKKLGYTRTALPGQSFSNAMFARPARRRPDDSED